MFLRTQRRPTLWLVVLGCLVGTGCDDPAPPSRPVLPPSGAQARDTDSPRAAWTAEQVVAQPETLHARIKERNPYYQNEARVALEPASGLVAEIVQSALVDLTPLRGLPFNALDLRLTPVADLTPLAGMPLTLLALEQTRVADLSPLRGMKLQKLYLNQTSVGDLSALAGMPLTEFMAVGTRIEDLEPLRGAPLEALWLNHNPVTNLTPLAQCPLVTLTLEGTRVTDLRPLAGIRTLRRLHLGDTPVQDLAPLAGLELTRLIFNPARITNGLEAVRNMSSLTELGVTLEGRMAPAPFWEQFK